MHGNAIDRDAVLPLIYASVAAGNSLKRTLETLEGMPHPATFWRWHMEDNDVRDSLARAREAGVEALMDEANDIADNGSNDTYLDAEGNRRVDTDVIQRSKLRVETRMKYAQMIAPRKYGPKLDVTSNGESVKIDETSAVARLAALCSGIAKRGEDAPDDAG